MSVFRVQDKTPEVYTSTSRDFQLIGRLYDCIINGIKFDTDSILDIINTDSIDSRLLKLLQTKIGFFSSKDITDESLRYVLKAFPEIIKHKGSLKSIKQAVCTFLKLNGIKSNVYINITNNSLSNPYTVEIGVDDSIKNTYILNEIFKYILPTGYAISYIYHKDFDKANLILESKISANIIIVKDSVSSLIRGNYISYSNQIEDKLLGSVGETQISSPYDIVYMGSIDSVSKLPQYFENESFHVGEVYGVYSGTSYSDFTVTYYVYEYDYVNNTYIWSQMSSGRSYNVFNSSEYGYFNSSDGNFYSEKSSYYEEDSTYIHSGVHISDDSNPESAKFSMDNKKTFLIDSNNGLIWTIDQDQESWVSHDVKSFGEKFYGGDPNTENVIIIPNKNSKIFRDSNLEYRVDTAFWEAEFGPDNTYVWSKYVGDITPEVIDSATTIIENDPFSAKIISNKDNFIYTDNSYWCFSSLTSMWENANIVHIDGNPNSGATIVPNIDVHVYNEVKSWTAIIDEYSDMVSPLDEKVLYIDNSTGNGFKYNQDAGVLEEVMHFMKANNVSEIRTDELEYLMESSLIEPAFRDNSTIFTDRYGNLFLL
ncbi:MAG: hypothetical protein J6T10_29015 [Methanobrevibacter sp.]|nr:hypothetical protein [Methanobrevibacter sp.]